MANSAATEGLASRIRQSLAQPITSDDVIDPLAILKDVLQVVGLEVSSGVHSIQFIGRDPVLKSPWPLATMAGVALMAKAVAAAGLWHYRTGRSQSLSLST
jgi:hypothetical protein